MPCRCDYLEPTEREKESVRVLTLLNSLGFDLGDPGCYGDTQQLDSHTALLGSWCNCHDMTKQSLELQHWWLGHKIEDKKREGALR